MGETARNVEHLVPLPGEFHGHMASVSGRTGAQVHRHVEHAPAHTAYQLGLGVFALLVMKPAHHTARGAALVVLHEMHRSHLRGEVTLRERLEKIAARIRKHPGMQYHNPLYIGLFYCHQSVKSKLSDSEATFIRYSP